MKISRHPAGYQRHRSALLAAVYAHDPRYRQGTEALVDLLLNKNSAFSKHAEIVPLLATSSDGRLAATTILVHSRRFPQVVQMAFFEALPHRNRAVNALIDEALDYAEKCGATRIVAGMNGHVNNGLGFLAAPTEQNAVFGSSYTPTYYTAYFQTAPWHESRLFSYSYEISATDFKSKSRVMNRLSRRFSVRSADFSRLQDEITTYTQLNNQCFATHPLYFERSPAEDRELFAMFRPFLRAENLLFAEHKGSPVGFLLWYPDFNELTTRRSNGLGLTELLRYRLLKKRISHVRVAEIGVHPAFQRQGAAVALIAAFHQRTSGRFSTCESGWIHDANKASLSICGRWHSRPGKEFLVFERGFKA